jgi:[acyl-carrier-protein] S-malonyltransferase
MNDVAFIFPGQGAQEVGMGREFYEQSPQAKEVFDSANQIIPQLTEVTFNGPQEKLTSTAFCQPAIFTFSLAALAACKAHPKFKNINPRFAAGLSLGELSAVVASGSLSFEEGLRLVERRSAFMEEATRLQKGKMAAIIGFEKEKIVAICKQTGAEIANFNAPDQIVITGQATKVEEASRLMTEGGAKRVIPLDVSGAFHSSLMKSGADKFTQELTKFSFKEAQFPIVSNVDGKPAIGSSHISSNLSKQITSSVQWIDSVHLIASQGVTTFIEIGPGNVLKGLIRKINRELTVHNIRIPADIDALPL